MATTAQKHGLTDRLLPAGYSYVSTRDEGQSALDIIDLEQAPLSKLSASPLDIQKAKIRELVLSEARELFSTIDPQAFKLLRLDERNLPLSGIRNESGFRLVNTEAIKRGDGMNAELLTVIFARSASDRDLLVPLVFAHGDREKKGKLLKERIDGYTKELHGAAPESMVRGTTYRLAQRFIEKLNGFKDFALSKKEGIVISVVIGAVLIGGIRGCSAIVSSVRRDQEAKQVEWAKGLPARVDFVKAQMSSMKSAMHTDTQGKLLDTIKLEHYDSFLDSLGEKPIEQRQEIANLVKQLVTWELSTKRSDSTLKYTVGAEQGANKAEAQWGVRMDKPAVRQQFLTSFLQKFLEKEFNPEVRAPILKALDEVASSYHAD